MKLINMSHKFLFVLYFITGVYSYKILGIFPDASRSHVDAFHPLMRGLALKGHDVTFVSHYEFEDTPKLTQLIIENSKGKMVNGIDLSNSEKSEIGMLTGHLMMAFNGIKKCHEGMSSPVFQTLLKSEETFDIVIIEFFHTDCFAPFAWKFKAHLVGASSCTSMVWTNDRFGGLYNPSYITNPHLDYTDKLSFWERIENTVLGTVQNFVYNVLVRMNDERIARMYFKEDFPSISEIVNNASAFLVNSHFSFNFPKPLVPQIVDVGGLHVREVRNLPQMHDFDGFYNYELIFTSGLILLARLYDESHVNCCLYLFQY